MLGRQPALAIYEFDEKWNLVCNQMHHIEGLNYAHDFLLLPDYYVFHMTPFIRTGLKETLMILSGLSSPGQMIRYFSDMPSRFVVIPRHERAAHQDIKLLDTEPFHVSSRTRKSVKVKALKIKMVVILLKLCTSEYIFSLFSCCCFFFRSTILGTHSKKVITPSPLTLSASVQSST